MSPRFLIVGFGSAGERALAILRRLRPSAQFLVVSRHAKFRADLEIVPSLSASSGYIPDAIILAGPATTRVETLRELGDISVPVFIEKPLATSLADSLAVVRLLGGAVRWTQVGYNLRFSESLNVFRDLVRSGRYGAVIRFSAETGQYLPDWRPDRDYRETVSAQANLGGGVLLELSHELDYLRWIFGELEWVSAWTGQTAALELDVEDTALLNMGIKAEGRSTQVVGQLSLDFARRDKTRAITAVCEKGTVHWDGIDGTVNAYEPTESSWSSYPTDLGLESSYEAQWGSFLSLAEGHRDPTVTVADGVEALRAVEGIRESSARSGARAYLDTMKADS